jgi:hypothetical protein
MWSGTARDIDLIWGGGEAEYFCEDDWTGGIGLNLLNKFICARKQHSPHERRDMRVSERYESPAYRFAYPGYAY